MGTQHECCVVVIVYELEDCCYYKVVYQFLFLEIFVTTETFFLFPCTFFFLPIFNIFGVLTRGGSGGRRNKTSPQEKRQKGKEQ